jgi:hypothetical protein
VSDSVRNSVPVYRDDAVGLVAAAARAAEPDPEPPSATAAVPEIAAEPRLRPRRPAGNDNRFDGATPRERAPQSPLRLAARVLIAPWYVFVALASVGVTAVIVKSVLGL